MIVLVMLFSSITRLNSKMEITEMMVELVHIEKLIKAGRLLQSNKSFPFIIHSTAFFYFSRNSTNGLYMMRYRWYSSWNIGIFSMIVPVASWSLEVVRNLVIACIFVILARFLLNYTECPCFFEVFLFKAIYLRDGMSTEDLDC